MAHTEEDWVRSLTRAEQIIWLTLYYVANPLATCAEGLQLSPVEIMMRIPLNILGAPCIQASYIQASENTHSSCYTEEFGCSFVGFIKSLIKNLSS